MSEYVGHFNRMVDLHRRVNSSSAVLVKILSCLLAGG